MGNPTRERGRVRFVLADASGFQNRRNVDVQMQLATESAASRDRRFCGSGKRQWFPLPGRCDPAPRWKGVRFLASQDSSTVTRSVLSWQILNSIDVLRFSSFANASAPRKTVVSQQLLSLCKHFYYLRVLPLTSTV